MKIAVIDDNRDAADSTAALLEMFGHQVFVSYGGSDGLEIIRRERPDVAVIDFSMPDLMGTDVARQVRAEGIICGLVSLTGHGLPNHKQELENAGFHIILTKPALFSDLANAIAASHEACLVDSAG